MNGQTQVQSIPVSLEKGKIYWGGSYYTPVNGQYIGHSGDFIPIDDVESYCLVYNLASITSFDPPKHVLGYLDESGGYTYYEYEDSATAEPGSAKYSELLKPGMASNPDYISYSEFKSIRPITYFDGNVMVQSGERSPQSDVKALYLVHTHAPSARSEAKIHQVIPGEKFQSHRNPSSADFASEDDAHNLLSDISPWDTQKLSKAFSGVVDPQLLADLQHADDEPDLSRMGISYYVVVYKDGSAMYYNASGDLTNIDACAANNKSTLESGFVDDYLTVNWGSNGITSVLAPPVSDGRQFLFQHSDPSGPLTDVQIVSSGGGIGGTKPLVSYRYDSDPESTGYGKLRVAITETNGTRKEGISYGYGKVTSSASGLSFGTPSSNQDPKLDRINIWTENGSTEQIFSRTAIEYDYAQASEPYPATTEWLFDYTNGVNQWRRLLSISNDDPDTVRVKYGMGELPGNGGRYDGLPHDSSDEPTTLYHFDDDGNVLRVDSSGDHMETPLTRNSYVAGTHLLDHTDLFVGEPGDPLSNEDLWVRMKTYTYDDPNGSNPQIQTVTQYLNYHSQGSGWVSYDPVVVSYDYYSDTDPVAPGKIHMITNPDGARTEVIYDAYQRPHFVYQKRLNHITSQYDTLDAVEYVYYTSTGSGAISGALHQIISTPLGLNPHTTSVLYYTTTNTAGALKGKVSQVTTHVGEADQRIVTYKYDGYGQVTEVSSDGETTAYTFDYSFSPPRLASVSDSTGPATTTFTYDDLGRVHTTTDALNHVTTYDRDPRGNLITITQPAGTTGYSNTQMVYDITGNLLQLTDPENNNTLYTYDAFGRQRSESAFGPDTGTPGFGDQTPVYTILYGYVGFGSGSGASCPSCASGGSSSIAWRSISHGSDEQTISFSYDLAGRLKTQYDATASRQIEYVYSGLKLSSIDHGGLLWGNDSLSFQYNDPYQRLTREVYPNGRYTEFGYDTAGRLSTVKDPFGFINRLGYDSRDRLGTLTHSALGQATLNYENTRDQLQNLILGDGSYTEYGYDAHHRLSSFDFRDPSDYRLFQHEWSYDALGRKDATAGITINNGYMPGWSPTAYTFAYDNASRVTDEKLKSGSTDLFHLAYGYDDAGNRTSLTAPSLTKTLGYGAANQEATVNGSASGKLDYDFKGNVTVRPPLAGGDSFNYKWDATDRLVSVQRAAQPNVNYKYDALGRLLWRGEGAQTLASAESPASVFDATQATAYYWLGLAPLAQEEWGDEAGRIIPQFRPAPETGATPENDGWSIASGGAGTPSLEYSSDPDRGKVVHLSTTSSGDLDGRFWIGDNYANNSNPNSLPWQDTTHRRLGFWIKNNYVGHMFWFNIRIETDNGPAVLQVRSTSGADYYQGPPSGAYVYPLLDELPTLNDGNWHYMDLDLNSLYHEFVPSGTITRVNGINFFANDIHLDDITLSAPATAGNQNAANLTVNKPDDESGATPADDGWGKLSWATNQMSIEYANDADRGKVLHTWSPSGGARYVLGDGLGGGLNPAPNSNPWNDGSRRDHFSFWLRNGDGWGGVQIEALAWLQTDGGSPYYQRMIVRTWGTPGTYTVGSGSDVERYIGDSYNDGAWHYIEVDLDAIAQQAFGLGTHVVSIDGIMTQGNNIYLDDFTFARGALRRTYQVVPGAAVGGVLGGSVGPNVADAGVRRYYHYNDLGTVLLQTRLDAAGTFGVEGAWEPDFFGNYEGRAAYPGSPTRPELGLAGQFFDTATGTYHFRYRDLDPERGRWLSREPLGLDGPNLYHFGFNAPVNDFDPNGLSVFDSFWNWWYEVPTGTDFMNNYAENVKRTSGDIEMWGLTPDEAGAASVELKNRAVRASFDAAMLLGTSGASRIVGEEVAGGSEECRVGYRSFTRRNFRVNLARLTGELPEGMDAHHVLPREFIKDFSRLGIDIHDPRFGSWWESLSHRRLAAEYNSAWRAFLRTKPNAQQVFQFARRLGEQYGFAIHF